MQRAVYLLSLMMLALCVTDAHARHHHSRASSDAQSGEFDYYLLSLSWAPTYCLTHTDDSAECSGRGYGFVVHGLWPQYDAGGYPENCATQEQLSADAAARGRTLYPSEGLMRHEWREHGTCSGQSALDYFQTVDRATAAVKVPQAMEAPPASQTLDAPQIAQLFAQANPQLPPGALTVACSRGKLSEVRVCLTRDLTPRACGRGVHSMCSQGAVSVPATR